MARSPLAAPHCPSAARGANRRAQHLQHLDRIVPAEAGVGDALAVRELGRIVLAGAELLRAVDQMALDHDAEDLLAAGLDLRGDVACHVELALVLLSAVCMRAID